MVKDEFLVKSNPEELIHSKPPTTRLEPRSATPSYIIEREREIAPRIISGQPKTDMLSEFMYRVPNVVFSPSKNIRGVSPAKSESLLYSPFSGGGVDTESRFSRPSSMKKGQQLY